METHPDPDKAMSDGPNAMPLDRLAQLLGTLVAVDRCVKQSGYLETDFGLGE
jgi:2-dehydro-3-deoxyphosphooctonate aldolase (KDO 8-P synthase)